MADLLTRIATEAGATVTIDDVLTRDREIWLRIVGPLGLSVTVDLDGDSKQEREGVFVLAWHFEHSAPCEVRLTAAFGGVAGGSVNAVHGRKCTGVTYSFRQTCESVAQCLKLAKDGSAFEPYVPFVRRELGPLPG